MPNHEHTSTDQGQNLFLFRNNYSKVHVVWFSTCRYRVLSQYRLQFNNTGIR